MSVKEEESDSKEPHGFYDHDATPVFCPGDEKTLLRICSEPEYKVFDIEEKDPYTGRVIATKQVEGFTLTVCPPDDEDKEMRLNLQSKALIGAFQKLGAANKQTLRGLVVSLTKHGRGPDSRIELSVVKEVKATR